MPTKLEVYRRQLFNLSAEIAEAGDEIRKSAKATKETGVASLPGWSTVEALDEVAGQWHVKTAHEAYQWDELSSLVMGYGENVSSVDQDNADSLNQLR